MSGSSHTLRRKLLRRVGVVLQNSFYSLLVPLVNIAISFLVIRLNSPALWGSFVEIMVVLHLLTHVAAWGNKEYLLREFSRSPQDIRQVWQTSLFSRLIFYGAICGFLLLIPGASVWVLLWGLSIVLSQSFDVLIIYRRDFAFAIGTELLTISIMIVGIITQGDALSITQLLALFAIATSIKCLLLCAYFRNDLILSYWKLNLTYFRQAGPFFILGFSGILASRIDLYTVSILLNEQNVAEYQVFINLMLYLQALSAFILLPYVKTLYRMPDDSILRISVRLFVLGIGLVIPATLLADALLYTLYDIQYSAVFMLLGGLFVLPIYGYIPLIHRLYKNDATRIVLGVNICGAAFNLALNLLLLPIIGILGAIIASAVVQWGMLIYYHLQMRISYVRPMPNLPTDDRPISAEA